MPTRAELINELEQFREIGFPTPSPGHPYELDLLDTSKDAVVRGRVLVDCALIEELSALVLMHYWLATDRAFMRLRYFGRIKKYRTLFDALGRLPARQKMTALKTTVKVPKSVATNIERILAVRDLLAHIRTVDPQNPGYTYKGLSIFSAPGFERYVRDATTAVRWFVRKARLLSDRGRTRVVASTRRDKSRAGTVQGQSGTIDEADEGEAARNTQ